MKILSIFLLLSHVYGFPPVPDQRRSFLSEQRYLSSSSTSDTKNLEAYSKEAKELLQAIQAKEDGSLQLIIAQVAPSVRVVIPEEFGREPCTLGTGNLIASLKAIGFDLVFDTNTGADLTICEEGHELLQRIKTKMRNAEKVEEGKESNTTTSNTKSMPLFTSCCPGWLNLVQKSSPELIPFISTCKSPHMMFGAIVKEFSTQLFNVPAEKVYFCSVMPCVRKRGESDHVAFSHGGIRDIDNVITAKDLGTILRTKQIDPFELQPETFDSPFATNGAGSGAGGCVCFFPFQLLYTLSFIKFQYSNKCLFFMFNFWNTNRSIIWWDGRSYGSSNPYSL